MDRVHRGLNPARLPVPPRPRATPRTDSTQWTQTGSNRHLTPCKGAALPLVLWAHGWSAGQESNLQCPKAPGLRPGAIPRRRPAAGPGVSRCGTARTPIRSLAISSVVKERFRRDGVCPYRNMGAPRQQGRRESNPDHDGVGNRPATGASPLRCLLHRVSARNTKEPPPFGSGSQTVFGPVKVQVMPLGAPPGRWLSLPGLADPERETTRTWRRAT
jgi:hypothetical protein